MLSEIELKNNHLECLELLDLLLDVCKKNDIKYFVAEGSAIGTVREQGFIPWDVNIDINMSYDDYKRLDFVLSNMDLGDKEWELPQNGRLVKWLVFKNPSNCSVRSNIDIGVLAPAPSNLILRSLEHLFLVLNYKAHRLKNNNVKRKFPYNVLKIVAKVFPEKLYYLIMDVSGNYSNMEDAEYITNITPGNLCLNFHTTKKEWYFGAEKWGYFEGRKVRLPSNYHAYLTSFYGDYMVPVREEKGVYHHIKK